MSNIVKKNENTMAEWNPFRSMRDLLRWDPFREMSPLWDRFEQLQREAWMPSFEVRETKDSYVFKADIPGVKKDDIDVQVDGNVVSIQAETRSEKEERGNGDRVLRSERYYGTVARTFSLGQDVDPSGVQAKYADGVLTLELPKKATPNGRRISVQ